MAKKPPPRKPQPHHPARDVPRPMQPVTEPDDDDDDEEEHTPPPQPPPHPEPPMPAAEQPQAQPQQSNVVPMQPAPQPQTASNAELLAIIAAQATLIQAQGTAVRDLETQLGLQPGGTPLVPGASANLQNLIDMHTAAIRTQAAYQKHLNDIQLFDANP